MLRSAVIGYLQSRLVEGPPMQRRRPRREFPPWVKIIYGIFRQVLSSFCLCFLVLALGILRVLVICRDRLSTMEPVLNSVYHFLQVLWTLGDGQRNKIIGHNPADFLAETGLAYEEISAEMIKIHDMGKQVFIRHFLPSIKTLLLLVLELAAQVALISSIMLLILSIGFFDITATIFSNLYTGPNNDEERLSTWRAMKTFLNLVVPDLSAQIDLVDDLMFPKKEARYPYKPVENQ